MCVRAPRRRALKDALSLYGTDFGSQVHRIPFWSLDFIIYKMGVIITVLTS